MTISAADIQVIKYRYEKILHNKRDYFEEWNSQSHGDVGVLLEALDERDKEIKRLKDARYKLSSNLGLDTSNKLKTILKNE